MQGIDVSSWNGAPFNSITEAAYKQSDFCIVKLTQGTSYLNPNADYAINRTLNDGKLLGLYHYASGHDAKTEAQYFYRHAKPYIGKAILCLDWEAEQNSAFGSNQWCKQFVDELYRLAKVYAVIYTGSYVLQQVSNLVDKCELWLAGYPDYRTTWNVPTFPYSIAPWNNYFIWQFTSAGGVDKNTCPFTKAKWQAIAKGNNIKEDVKDIMTDINEVGKKVWAYKNAKLEKRDAYGILREIRDDVKTIKTKIVAIEKKIK